MIKPAFCQKNNPLDDVLEKNPNLFGAILNHPQKNEVQILYTQINRDKNNKAHFKTYSFNLNNQHYFYPASTVKLPASVFALEKLNELNIENLDMNTVLKIDSAYHNQTKVDKDLTSKNGEASIANYIKKILLVSDNDAFNRIYEFTDRATINKKLKKYGFKNSRIINRLSVGDNAESSKHTNPINFYNNNKLIYTKPAEFDAHEYPIKLNNLLRGKGYLGAHDKVINEPFDFTGKNVFQLTDQHEFIKRLFFPSSFPKNKQFNLKPKDYDFLYTYMSKYPTENDFPKYAKPNYYPAYCKFLFYGADESMEINPNIRIFNKVGDAYGYSLDNIYLIDYENKVEFILSAVIQSNKNEIYNDNKYEYESVCFPFMKNLGQKIYDLELKRDKKYLPNFNFMLNYK
ncbi:serine hydrolase [Pedobacter alpinus]|uniref:Serine hydrolase n=1 Tax=Pedobacter alpinus TaxID=1590643 RepID=A0ABW5TT61_9SPHI